MSDNESSDREDPQVENRDLARSVEEEMSARNAELQLRRDARNERQASRRRGRQPLPREPRLRELRLTPPDGQPVDSWYETDAGISKLLACEEGGIGTGKALHYHAIIETTLSDDALQGWIRRVLRIPFSHAMGNAVYRTGAIHEASYQYVVKNRAVVCRLGYTDDQIAEWCRLSDEYRRDVNAQRRSLQRLRSQGREKQLRTIEEVVFNIGEQNVFAFADPTTIVRHVLTECDNANIEFPTRTQMEAMVNRICWKLGRNNQHRGPQFGERVVDYYARALIPRTNFS